jgi:DNA repair photolyase
MKKNPHSYAQKSINTPDPEDWRHLSPGALPLEEHFEDIKRIKKAGIYVSIQCNPIIPGVVSNDQVCELFSKLKKAGADHVIIKFVEAGYSWAPTMIEKMIKRFGDRGKAFGELFTDNIGGQRTIQEEYRLKAHKKFAAHAKKIGLTYATCYEYKYARDAKGDIIDKVGVSIGREFTTSSQCHGHKVPMYSRLQESKKFQPVPECPPSGCLYCADENQGKPRCGDDLAGEANASRFSDFKLPIGIGKARTTSVKEADED